MSNSTSSDSGMSLLASVYAAVPGGWPLQPQDQNPSIVFLVAYVLLIPLCLWRILRPESRTGILIRPTIFIPLRIATWVCRIIQGQQTTAVMTGQAGSGGISIPVSIAEEILLGIGFLLITEPLHSLLFKHKLAGMVSYWSGADHARRIVAIVTFYCIVAAIVVNALSGSLASSDTSGPNGTPSQGTLDTMHLMRTVGSVVSLLTVAVLVLISLYCLIANPGKGIVHQRVSSFVLSFCTVMLLLVTGYRLYVVLGSNSGDSSVMFAEKTKVIFYVLQATPEWLSTAMLFAVNVRELFQTYLQVPFVEPLYDGGYKDYNQQIDNSKSVPRVLRIFAFGYYK